MVPIKKRLSLCVSKMQQTASMAVLYTHRYCSRLRLCLSRGHENCAMAEIQLPHGTGLHATLPAANTTRKQRATPPKPSTINLCLLAIFMWQAFTSMAICTPLYPGKKCLQRKFGPLLPSKNPKKPPHNPKATKNPKTIGGGGGGNYTICHLIL